MKKTLLTLLGLILLPTIAYATTAFNSSQVGSSPTTNYVLLTNGSVSSWVATSTLGLGGSGGGTVNQVNTTWPIIGGPITNTGTLTFGGLSTSTAAVKGNIPYFSGVNTFANVATSSLGVTSPITFSGTLGAQVGGAAGNFACATCLTGNQTITLSGDTTGSGATSITTTLATVNGNVGSFGGVSSIPSFTVNAKGLITAASANTPSIPVGDITGVLSVANGGTASSTLGGIITGAGTSAVTSATIGSGLSFLGNTLSNSGVTSLVAGTNVTISGATGAVTINATGGGGGSGTVGTSTVPTVGNLSYWTSNGFPSLLGTVATTTVSCSGSSSCTPFVAIGGSPITISSSGGSGSIYPFTPSTFGATNTSATSTNINDTAGFSSTASSTLFSLTTLNSTSTNATTTAFAQIGLNATSTFASGIIAPCFATSTAGNCITPSQLVSETPTGTINGSNTAFTVVHTPTFLILNGAVYTQGVDYTLSGLSVTMTIAPVTGSVFRSYYGSVLGGSGGGGTSIIRNVIATSSSGIMASLANNDYTYLASSTSPLTLTLPAAAGNSNIYVVKDNGTTTVTVASASAIDNASTTVLGSIYQAVTLQSDGTNWWIQ